MAPTKMDHNGTHYCPANTDSDDDNVPKCGIGRFKPKSLRFMANMKVFTGTYSCTVLLSSTLSSYVNSQVTTLERHFGFSSSQTGVIMAANDIGFLVVVLFITYIAAKVHIPRAMGMTTILFGISGVICAVPYFMFGAPSPLRNLKTTNASDGTEKQTKSSFFGQMCDGINSSTECVVKDLTNALAILPSKNYAMANNTSVALAIIVIGMALQGIAKAPRYSFATTYVDAHVQKIKTGFYMGIITCLGVMGPALAYAMGGLFARIYVTLQDTDISPRHPKWIGAWWLGYITIGCVSCVFALPLFLFPNRMKGQKNVKEPHKVKANPGLRANTIRHIKEFVMAIIRLLTNPVFMCTLLSSCSLLFSVAGIQSFTPKYIENQFSFLAWKANMFMAGLMLATSCVGTFFGGYVTKRFKMGPLGSIKFAIIVQALSVLFTSLQMALKCDQPNIYNSPGPRATTDETTAGCFEKCACDDKDYFPICGDDGRTYFSPCHAGCVTNVGSNYFNCTCIAGRTATQGMCDYSCPMFYLYMICLALSSLSGTFAIIPKLIIYIRSVEERDKSFALGFNSFMNSITGWMLGPIIFGGVVDGICIQWDTNTCGGRGACRLYDNDLLRFKMIGFQAGFRFLALMFMIVALVYAIRTKRFERTSETTNLTYEMTFTSAGDDHKDGSKAHEKINLNA